MAANPFYIQPSQANINPVLQGIGALTEESRAKAKQQADEQALMTVYKSGDADSVAAMIAKNPELGAQIGTMLKFKSKETEKNYADSVRQLAATSDPEARGRILVDRIDRINAEGGDPAQTVLALEQLQQGDTEGFEKSLELEFARTQGKQAWEAYKAQRGGGDNKEFRKEERKNASQDLRSFNKEAKQMRTDYGKLKGLAEQAKGGSRGARNAMVVSLARLVSPGIVTETEASALSGGQNTLQYVLGVLKGKDPTSTEGIERYVDPYGDSFDSDGLLKVGESVVASSRKPLIDAYESSRDRASRAGISPSAFNTNFGENKNYDFLRSFDEQPASVQDLSSIESMDELKALRAEVISKMSPEELRAAGIKP